MLAAPLAVEAQQGMRRVAVVLGYARDDHEGQVRLAAFVETLARLGWSDGRNVRLDIRWAGGNVARAAWALDVRSPPCRLPCGGASDRACLSGHTAAGIGTLALSGFVQTAPIIDSLELYQTKTFQ